MTEETPAVMRHFTEQEVENAVWENEVYQTELGTSRWTRTISSIVEIDNRFYDIIWEQGLTENQENQYEEGDYEEVRKEVRTEAKAYTGWVPVNSPKPNEKAKANMKSYVEMLDSNGRKMLSEALDAADNGDYSRMNGIDATDGMSAAREVAEDYISMLRLLRNTLNEAD